ncbi:alpha/beta fold hydrolase [Microbacterium sp. EST19A]|uniref:alpha/beta fold hydrolase n=1 Tax=Microbacterium sp. EST19A TaxID=2862681 RepID=UPI001CBD5E3E|nr:alpha/beta hydrolase [Microbacterium sp. EST19A]
MTDAPAWFTEALAVTTAVGTVEVAGARIAYRTWGTIGDDPHDVLLVHGGAAHSRWWDFIAPQLAAGRRVVAVDLSGHGDSGRRPAYSVEQWIDELDAVIDAAQLRPRPVVAGHSLGGMIASALAGRTTPELGGLIVVDSPIEPSGPWPRTEADATFSTPRVYRSLADGVARFRPVPPQHSLPYTAAHIAAASLREVAGGWSWKFDPAFVAMTGDLPHTLDGLACPAVYVAGEHGILSPQGRAALDASTEVRVIEIPDAGHAMMLDQPVALTQVLQDALAWFAVVETARTV